MRPTPSAIRLAQVVTIAVVMYAAIQLAFYLGVDEKSWIQRSWEILAGGGFGLVAGAVVFALVGTIGWVSGPVFGAVGLIGLATGGALGGLGLGAVVNVIRDPDRYNIDFVTVVGVIIVGALASAWLARLVGGRLSTTASRQ